MSIILPNKKTSMSFTNLAIAASLNYKIKIKESGPETRVTKQNLVKRTPCSCMLQRDVTNSGLGPVSLWGYPGYSQNKQAS